MKNLDILKYFDFVLASYDVACAKPDAKYVQDLFAGPLGRYESVDHSTGMEYWNAFFIYNIQEGRDQRSCWTFTVKKEVVCVHY